MKRLIAIAMLLLMTGSVSAFPISVNVEERTITPDRSAVFGVEIKNSFNSNRTFEALFSDNDSSWRIHDKSIEIPAGETRNLTLNTNISPETRPGRKNFTVRVETNTGEFNQSSNYFIIERESSIFFNNTKTPDQDESQENGTVERGVEIRKEWERNLMTSKLAITATNPAESENTATIQQSFPVFLAPITSFNPKPESSQITGGEQKVEWTLNLQPGQTETVSYITSYKLPLIALALLLASLAGLKTLEKQPRITKELKQTGEGVTVTLHIENHSGTTVDRLEVEDFIPSVLEVDEFKANEPVVAKTENGTRLEWDVEDLQAGESRAIIYTVKPDFVGKSNIEFSSAEMSSPDIGKKKSDEITLEDVKGK